VSRKGYVMQLLLGNINTKRAYDSQPKPTEIGIMRMKQRLTGDRKHTTPQKSDNTS
jgi:hypothetical protein